jgi:hypothetical protein
MAEQRRGLRSEQILAAALGRAGGATIDNLSFCEGLDALVHGLNGCRLPHAAGRTAIEQMMIEYLARRIKVERYWREHAELAEQPVERPVFVMGVPRTGTTLTVNLLNQDDRRRTLRKWEVNEPLPPPMAAQLRTDPRCLAQIAAQRLGLAQGKLKSNIHFEWADDPTECVFVHMHDFKSAAWDAFLPMPSYSEFLLNTDMRPTYQWHKRMLQVLQSKAPGHWALKAPSHALFVAALLDVYPDARLIWTHRDPLTAVASIASLIANVHRRFADDPDILWVRSHYPGQAAAHVNRAMAARRGREAQFFDLYYDDLVSDPLAEMRRLYAWLGDEFTPDVAAAMSAWLAANPQGKMGAHTYSLEQFGIDPVLIKRLFADYLQQHPRLARAGDVPSGRSRAHPAP